MQLANLNDAILQLVEDWLRKFVKAVALKVVEECHTEHGLVRTLNQAKDWL